MINHAPSLHRFSDRLSAAGIHCKLTDALRHHIVMKAGRLLRHQPRIDHINVDLIYDQTHGPRTAFVAKGRIELKGNDLVASAAGADAYAAVNLLVTRLDRALRKRATAFDARHRTHLLSHWSSRPGLATVA